MRTPPRLATLACAGALVLFGGALAPPAHPLSPAARATDVTVHVDSIKISNTLGHFVMTGRVYVTSSSDWSLDLWVDQYDNCRFPAGAPLAKKGGSDFTGGPTTAHEVPFWMAGKLTVDKLNPGSFRMNGRLRQGAEDSDTGTVPSVPEVFETFTVSPQPVVKDGAGGWTMNVAVTFKVNSHKTTMTSDELVQRARAFEGLPTVISFAPLPESSTYFSGTYQMSGTYVHPEPDPVDDPQALTWSLHVPDPAVGVLALPGLKHVSKLHFN